MPNATVTQAFHFAKGGEVLRFKKGAQDLPQDALDHAVQHGFVKEDAGKQPSKPRRTQAAAATVEEPKHGTD
ncbi:hypothetical protein [Halopseudomonas bauzanensis]|uniref:hypothetical protein n=1 Tax=Halopseudomonas bauzanensis TaxID=653930 RepID=UPI002554D588|nr:glycogen branching protein [Halopseudomonas bauzanensis]